MVTHFQEMVEEYSPGRTVPILGSTSQHYQLIAKAANNTIDLWYTPMELFGDNTLPVAYQAVPKRWITDPGVEVFISPVLDSEIGIGHAHVIFGRSLAGQRVPNHQNPQCCITIVTWRGEDYPDVQRSFASWD
jgi:hypothetical protein